MLTAPRYVGVTITMHSGTSRVQQRGNLPVDVSVRRTTTGESAGGLEGTTTEESASGRERTMTREPAHRVWVRLLVPRVLPMTPDGDREYRQRTFARRGRGGGAAQFGRKIQFPDESLT